MSDTVEARVKMIVSEQLGVDLEKIGSDDQLGIEGWNADSMDMIEMVMAAEEEFDLEITDEDAEKLLTVQGAIDYVVKARE